MRTAAILLALSAAGCGSSGAGGPACPHDPGFNRSGLVSVRAEFPPAALRRDLDVKQLSALSKGAGETRGLTEVEHSLSFEVLMNGRTRRGRTCVWADQVRVDITPSAVRIFVPREYAEGSCESDAVLAHEREHERVYGERLAAAAREIDAALTAADWLPGKGNPIEASDRASAEAALKEKVRKVIAPVYAKYKEELAAAQADLDRPDLYRWASWRCPGWQ